MERKGVCLIMTNQEINHKIAVDVKGWTHLEDIWYDDGSGFWNPLPDYCNSPSHAIDLMKFSNISVTPHAEGFEAKSVDNPDVAVVDAVFATAIAKTAVAIFDSQQA